MITRGYKNWARLAAVAAAAAVVVGCGDDPVTPTSTIVVSDPYATGCTVTVGGATATETTTAGVYRVTAALNGANAVVATNSVDSVTGVKLPDLRSDGSASGLVEIVSPVTTMIEALVASGTPRAEAKSSVATILNVPEANLEKDPVSDLGLQKAASFVTSVLDVVRSIVQTANVTGATQTTIVNAALTSLVTTAKTTSTTVASVDLNTVLTSATASIAQSNPTAANAIKAQANDLATARQVIEAKVTSATSLEDVAKVAKAVNETVAAQVATGNVTNLGSVLDTAVAATSVPAIVVISDPTTATGATGAGS